MSLPNFSPQGYVYQYNIPFFDDIHNFFPDLLYAPLDRFNSASSILIYIREQVRLRADRFSAAQRMMNNNYNYTYNNILSPTMSRVSSPSPPMPASVSVIEPVAPPAPVPVPVPVPAPAPTSIWNQIGTVPIPDPPNRIPVLSRQNGLITRQDIDFMDSLLNIFAQPVGSISIFGTTLADNLSPVNVYPSATQIDEATTVFTVDASNTDGQCTICFENQVIGQSVRRINHCGHTFHKNCIDRWFTTNVRCPNCRHDIRESDATDENDENEYEYDDEEDDYQSSQT
jgi:hypothetical protein